MKTNIYKLIAIALVSILLIQTSGCKSKDDTPTPSAADAVKAKLIAANPWKILTATVDGVDQTLLYKGLTLTFTATGYTSTNGGAVWPASGTWLFNNTDGTSIKRDDGLIIAIEVTDTTLKLSYTLANTTLGGGRKESLKGAQVLTFIK